MELGGGPTILLFPHLSFIHRPSSSLSQRTSLLKPLWAIQCHVARQCRGLPPAFYTRHITPLPLRSAALPPNANMSLLNSAVTRFATTMLLLLTLICQASAQQLLVFGSSALPECAKQCGVLSQAQAACTPPQAAVTTAVTYESCFCQSAYLTTLKTDPASSCGTVCSGTDLSQIAQWYTNNCADGGVAAAASVSASGTTTTAAAATEAAATSTSTSTSSSSVDADNGSSGITEEQDPDAGGW